MKNHARARDFRQPLVDHRAWAPSTAPAVEGGRPPTPARAALTGIRIVRHGGIPWELLPLALGRGSGITCWRRLRDWQAAGIPERWHRALLRRLHDANRIDWSRAGSWSEGFERDP